MKKQLLNEVDKLIADAKSGMLKEEYNDDFTDSVSDILLGMRYLYIPPVVNG